MKAHSIVRPLASIAIGKSAEFAFACKGIPRIPVSHPAHGGARKFEEGITKIFEG
jgi:hypothetical protein